MISDIAYLEKPLPIAFFRTVMANSAASFSIFFRLTVPMYVLLSSTTARCRFLSSVWLTLMKFSQSLNVLCAKSACIFCTTSGSCIHSNMSGASFSSNLRRFIFSFLSKLLLASSNLFCTAEA